MNVLIDHQMFTIQRFGGITRIFIELMRELSKEQDCSLHWHRGLHIDEYDISDFKKRLKRYWSLKKIPFLQHMRTNEDINKLSFEWFIKLFNSQYDIYHPTYYDYSLINSVKAKKLALTVHDMIPEKHLVSLPRFQKLIEDRKLLIEKADLVFVNSQSTKNDLLEMFRVDDQKVFVTYWASRMSETSMVELPAVCKKKPYFLYVGTRSKYKNFDVLMKAVALDEWLKSGFNVICFGGSGDFLEPELKFFEQHAMADNFIYLSGNDSLLKTLYVNAQSLIYTSRYEGFGLPPLEAMECKCPVVCCRTSSIPEVVGDAALFFDPDSPEKLIKCMYTVVKDSVKRSDLIQMGLNRGKLFSWEKSAKETLRGYKSI